MDIKPMLAKIGTEDVLSRKDHYFEIKLDGIRSLCFKKTKLKFSSRNGITITDKYPEFDFFDAIEMEDCILDGEIVIYDKQGNPSFHLWQERNSCKGEVPEELLATYVVFDILFYNGKSMLNEPLYVRKKLLDNKIKEHPHLQLSPYTKNGKKLWEIAKEKELEGVMAKKDDSSYELGKRSDQWLKIKLFSSIDCVVLGYTAEKRKLTSLALGLHDNGELLYVGKVGTGFDERMMDELRAQLDEHLLENSDIEMEKGIIPVEPFLVVEVKYQNITQDKKLRAPVFLRVREKESAECEFPD